MSLAEQLIKALGPQGAKQWIEGKLEGKKK